MNIQPPYRIGLSSYNGILDHNHYMDSVEIYKLSVLNKEYDKRLQYKVENSTNVNIYRKGEVYINLDYLSQLKRELDILDSFIANSKERENLLQLSDLIAGIRMFSGEDNIDNHYNYLLDKLYTFNFTETFVRNDNNTELLQLEEYLYALNKTAGRIIADYEVYMFPYKRTKIRVLALMLPVFVLLLYLSWKILSNKLIKLTKLHDE
jgi:hypothetical protein